MIRGGLRSWPVCGALFLAAALSGCACSTERAGNVEPPVTLMSAVDLSTLTFPLDAYRATTADLVARSDAFMVVLGHCLARFGVERVRPATAGPVRGRGYERRYGITDEEQALAHGYHQAEPRRSEADVRNEPQDDRGQPNQEKGCADEAGRQVHNGTTLGTRQRALPDQLDYQSYRQAEQDSRVRAVAAAWSGCMKRAGYDYTNPMAANNDPAFTGPQPLDNEIATAIADVRCKKETNLVAVRASVEVAYSKRAVEQNAAALDRIKRDNEIIQRNAAEILAHQ